MPHHKELNSGTINFDHLKARLQRPQSDERDHPLQRIIETLQDAGIFHPDDKKWGPMYWRKLLKRHCEKYGRSYRELENIIGKRAGRDSYGLMKELQDLPSKYPAYGWLRNRLK